MRMVRASLADAYNVHKMYSEFLQDTGRPTEKEIFMWISAFENPDFFCFMALHGKKYVGMVWGTAKKDSGRMIIEGIFVKRGFRSRLRAIRSILDASHEIMKTTGAVAVSAVVPENLLSSVKRKGFKVREFVVEKRFGG